MIFAVRQPWQLELNTLPLRYIVPAFAGFTLLFTSFLPWLRDPLMGTSSAWRIPVYIGWPLRTPLLNYGVLSLCGAIYVFYVAYTSYTSGSFQERYSQNLQGLPGQSTWGRYRVAAWICLIPLLLFCLQYLVFDVQSIDQLAQNKLQALLIAPHLEYRLASQRIPIKPFAMDTSLLNIRLILFVNQVSLGVLLPVAGSISLFSYRLWLAWRQRGRRSAAAVELEGRGRWVKLAFVALFVALLFGRVPLSLFCEYEVNLALAGGAYDQASQWLDSALFFDPLLNQTTYYHMQRGQVLYFLNHDSESDDSRVYLATTSYQQVDYTSAYQQMFAVWERNRTTPWVLHEMSYILMRSAERNRPLGVDTEPVLQASQNNDQALPVLQELIQIDPGNIYAHYVAGRINYDLHAYVDCTIQMQIVAQLSRNRDIQSTAFTYMGLSEEGQGDFVTSRQFLLKAVELDPNFFNNTAREELSGLH